MLLGKKLCYSIRWIRNNRKNPDQYGISLNPEQGADCTNLHMFPLHQSVLVIVIWIPLLSLSDEKCKTYEVAIANAIGNTKEGSSCWELDPTLCPPFQKKWKDELIYLLYWIRRGKIYLSSFRLDRLNYNPRKIRCTASFFLFFFLIGFHSNH